MTTFGDLRDYFLKQQYKLIIVSDGEPAVSVVNKEGMTIEIPAGGVSVALDPIARATGATYIARAKKEEEKLALDKNGKMLIGNADGNYILKRLFISEKDLQDYYYGFSNQTLWPLCHVAFEEPIFRNDWFHGYKKVNQQFANAIRQELTGKAFIWLHDYQLAMVPFFLGKLPKDTLLAIFWHIPWPTWEVFRILPYKKEILTSLLSCDFLAFHRGYQARNFLHTVDRELEARIDLETQQVYFNKHVTTVKSLPLGIDIDVVKSLVHAQEVDSPLANAIRDLFGIEGAKPHPLDWYFDKYKVIFGVDRLDYTKGIRARLHALDRFFDDNPMYQGKVVYLGVISPSRETIPSYIQVKKETMAMVDMINKKYQTVEWKPIHMIYQTFKREDVINFYHKADVCVVTPLDDGMNLVSKEFVIASAASADPGVLILSQFAGSATDLSQALIVNPYNIEEVSRALKIGLEMDKAVKKERIRTMAEMLEERNVYEWGYNFIRDAIQSAK